VTAAELTRLLGGQWRGRGHGSYGTARCPVHDDGNPSLSIRQGIEGPIVKCFAGCDWRDIRDELRRRGLLAAQGLGSHRQPKIESTGSPASRKQEQAEGSARALALWEESGQLSESAFEYFASRRIPDLDALPDIHGALRFHPHCPFGPGARHPCIIALWTDTLTGKPKAIHRTALKPDGSKLDRN
jgi:putative DNA primase/helicase